MWDAVDLFAGPGGWDVAAASLGLRAVGIELDEDACQTAVAAGHARVRADVTTLPLQLYEGVPGHLGSPPCPTFSMAGHGSGRHDLPLLLQAIKRLGAGEDPSDQLSACEDERTALTLEPLRWLLRLNPVWAAWEQVPGVLPVWEACAAVLRERGYSVATGILNAEEHGVPQSRRRAVLVANRTTEVRLPTPTHSRYAKGRSRVQPRVLPWVGLGDALAWAGEATVISNYGTGGDPRARGERTRSEPAATVTSKVDRNIVQRSLASGTRANAAIRRHDEPSPTLAFGNDSASFVLIPGGTAVEEVPSLKAEGASSRLTVEEAGVLQTFPRDYPWTGNRSSRFQQVGNAVPPLLARATILSALGDLL